MPKETLTKRLVDALPFELGFQNLKFTRAFCPVRCTDVQQKSMLLKFEPITKPEHPKFRFRIRLWSLEGSECEPNSNPALSLDFTEQADDEVHSTVRLTV